MIRDEATERQVQAADPAHSTWLSANAGSGKTRVLTDRVARLLLDGVNPLHILCLTYTKAAASEMQNRLFDRLGTWAMMPDDKLREEMAKLGAAPPRLDDARTLFARAIETPGGLRIQTIHSFCSGLLRRFPLEAKISPQFREMEDQQAAHLRAEIMDQMSLEVPDKVAGIAAHVTDEGLDKLLSTIAGKRKMFLQQAEPTSLRSLLGLAPDMDSSRLIAQTISPQDHKVIADLVRVCASGSKTEVRLAAKLRSLSSPFGLSDLAVLEGALLFGDSAKTPFGPKVDAVMVKANQKEHPELNEAVNDLCHRVAEARQTRLSLLALKRTEALYAFATEFIRRYDAAKLARGLLDFDDLIGKARALLNDPNVAQWVLFRLDGGIDHILVDEAQDTSPEQWDVIRSLAQEFSAGLGAQEDRARSIFVVGDKKQSIYSFQGADPAGFDKMRDHFETGLRHVGEGLSVLSLEHSFRSSEAILNAVDLVFRGAHTDFDWDDAPHRAFKSDMPGRVDLWPVIEQVKAPEDDFDWTAPVDTVGEQDANVTLAREIAAEIKRMIREETIPVEIGHTGSYNHRPVTEGDILILVQRRSDLFAEIIRACKQAGLNIAGADRLKVGAELAVRDIASLLRFLALPEDDLSLAEALKSPLFGWSEQDLYALAQPRPEGSYLWEALRERKDHPETMAVLQDLRDWADFLRPYDLINRLLTRHDGRRKLLARLGPEAEDGIDALLSQALGYESSEVPGLTGFLEWMQTGELEIKRQLDTAGNRIRVMTVHGAKGLEAPIVFLPDTARRKPPTPDTLLEAGETMLWPGRKSDTPDVMQSLQAERTAEQEAERRRLLYVAMTRAECWLIACGVDSTNKDAYGWHDMMSAGVAHLGAADRTFPTGAGERYETGDWLAGQKITPESTPETLPTAPTDFAVLDAHPKATETRSPSDLGGAKVLPGETGTDDEEDAKARGTLIHLLLEHLPEYRPEQRSQFGQRLIDGSGLILPDSDTLLSDVLGLLTAPALSGTFEAHGLTEVPITAELPGLGRLHGAIDRLIVTEKEITAIDYKSNRIVPQKPEDTPDGLLAQMGAYQAMLAQIWPDHQITTAILWTATASLMPLPPALVSMALARVS